MSYAIVYDSRTGNTEALARAVAALPSEGRLAFGRVDEVDRAAVAQADRVYAGFWTNRGDCGDELAEVLASLADKDVFLFGTAGFGADETYFAGVMARVAVHLPESARIVGTFMCQGRMPASVRARYAQTAEAKPEQAARMHQLIENFDEAASHPDDDDLRVCAKLSKRRASMAKPASLPASASMPRCGCPMRAS
ncbi:MAG: flavodoxin family protein BilS [Eggerthella lenta]